jgi:hypothetical protein
MITRGFARFAVLWLPLLVMPPATAGSGAAAEDSLSARVDRLFAPWDKPDSPGCALGVVKDGRIVYSRGYGMADLEHDVPITPASAFYVGSLSKQFTAMTVALLAQQGTLRLDDDIRKYLPELPAYGTPITVGHLVHHTSGLRECMPLLARAGWRSDAPFGNQDVLEIISRERGVNFLPGEQYAYSNTGYTLLALIEDLAKWDQNFYDARVGGKALITQITTPGTLNSGRALEYAFGLEVRDYRGLHVVEHGGSLVGYQAHLMRFPDQRFSVMCLCNLSNINPSGLARAVAGIHLADQFAAVPEDDSRNLRTIDVTQSQR